MSRLQIVQALWCRVPAGLAVAQDRRSLGDAGGDGSRDENSHEPSQGLHGCDPQDPTAGAVIRPGAGCTDGTEPDHNQHG